MKSLSLFATLVTTLLIGACNPPGVTLVLQNDFSLAYIDLQNQETGQLESFISSETSLFSRSASPNNEEDSLIIQSFYLLFKIDTGLYNTSIPSFREVGLSFNHKANLADLMVIGTNDWGQPIYSFIDPDQYLTDFFPVGPLSQLEFGSTFGLNMNAYGYLTTLNRVSGPSGEDSFIIEHSEIITEDDGRKFLYVAGQFRGTTISQGYPTVSINPDGVIQVTRGTFSGKWAIN